MRVGRKGMLLIMTVALAAMPAACARHEAPPPSVTVASDPTGATVTMGGEVLGKTPVTFQPKMAGTIVLEVQKEGYKPTTELVEVPKEGEVQLNVTLVRKVGYVSLSSVPSAVSVYMDQGDPVGQTPITNYPVPTGKHVFTFVEENYESKTREVDVQEDYRYNFREELTPKPAQLIIYSQPTGARVWLNNVEQSKVTPNKFEVQPGTYSVMLQAAGFQLYQTTLTLTPGQNQSLDAKLTPGAAPPGMVLVPEGEFVFGLNGASPDERPQQIVHLKAFYIDRTEVTNSQYQAVFPSYHFEKGKEDVPVTGLSYKEAAAYADAVGKRLPTEQEWEKAARGTDGRLYPWGNDWDPSRANCGDDSGAVLRHVGSYPDGASPYGCLDMAGNAYEWTSSWYEAYPGNTGIKTEYGQVYKVLRGGSFRTGHLEARCPARFYEPMDMARDDFGFRCAMDVKTPKGNGPAGTP